MTLSSLAHTI